MFKVGVVYKNGKKEITYLSPRSMDWVIRIIKTNNHLINLIRYRISI
jgi:hypothetical protein